MEAEDRALRGPWSGGPLLWGTRAPGHKDAQAARARHWHLEPPGWPWDTDSYALCSGLTSGFGRGWLGFLRSQGPQWLPDLPMEHAKRRQHGLGPGFVGY